MSILFEVERITRRSQNTFTKIQFVGTIMNYTQKNRGMGFARRVCDTNAKLAIKQNDKQEFDERSKWYEK